MYVDRADMIQFKLNQPKFTHQRRRAQEGRKGWVMANFVSSNSNSTRFFKISIAFISSLILNQNLGIM